MKKNCFSFNMFVVLTLWVRSIQLPVHSQLSCFSVIIFTVLFHFIWIGLILTWSASDMDGMSPNRYCPHVRSVTHYQNTQSLSHTHTHTHSRTHSLSLFPHLPPISLTHTHAHKSQDSSLWEKDWKFLPHFLGSRFQNLSCLWCDLCLSVLAHHRLLVIF